MYYCFSICIISIKFPKMQFTFVMILIAMASSVISQYPTFSQYTVKFSKSYTPAEYDYRQKLYQARISNFINITGYTPGVNARSDWSQEEINNAKTLLTVPMNSSQGAKVSALKLSAPQELDWRTKNAVTSIKQQGNCGCCWAFASAAYAQSKLIIAGLYTIDNINLSEQYMLECTKQGTCSGGYLQYAMEQIRTIPTEEQYPYSPFTKHSGICSANGVRTGYIPNNYYSLSDAQLIDLLQTGPVAISISSVNWENYKSGVFQCSPNDNVDHAVLLVGYTASEWIIKNQWSTNFGENGYIRVTRNRAVNCKIGTSAFILFSSRFSLGLWLLMALWWTL